MWALGSTGRPRRPTIPAMPMPSRPCPPFAPRRSRRRVGAGAPGRGAGAGGFALFWALGAAAALTAALVAGPMVATGGPTGGVRVRLVQDGPAGDTRAELPEATLLLKGGRLLTGLLVSEDASGVTLRIGGLDQRYRREQIERLEVMAPVQERYEAMREAIADDDLDRIMLLVEWLRQRERYLLALKEVEHVLALDPGRPDAQSARVLLEQQIELIEKARRRGPTGRPAEREPSAERPPREAPPEVPLLNAEQINLIKVFETDLSGAPDLIIPRDVIDELLERYKGEPGVPTTREGQRALYQRRPVEVLALMFKLRARELYGRVQVMDHPPALEIFRSDVHRTWLQNACATSQCHGGTEAGRLWLATRRPNSDATVYTNFMILERFRMVTPEHPEGIPLLNHENPERSPLLQMTLPEDISLFPHPPLRGRDARRFRTPFRSMDDRGYRRAVAWLEALYRPRPEYPIEYEPPVPPGAGDPSLRVTPMPR